MLPKFSLFFPLPFLCIFSLSYISPFWLLLSPSFFYITLSPHYHSLFVFFFSKGQLYPLAVISKRIVSTSIRCVIISLFHRCCIFSYCHFIKASFQIIVSYKLEGRLLFYKLKVPRNKQKHFVIPSFLWSSFCAINSQGTNQTLGRLWTQHGPLG